jgi:hypothetical protein
MGVLFALKLMKFWFFALKLLYKIPLSSLQ